MPKKITLFRTVLRMGNLTRRIVTVFVVALCFCFSVTAEEHKFVVKNISMSEGLSQNSVSSIVQDKQGFIWFGTQDGLNRYDGNKFKVYRPDLKDEKSISSNGIRALILDHKGVLWVGTSKGVSKYDQLTDSFSVYVHIPNDPTSLSKNDITTLFEDSKGNIWVGTRAGGLNRLNRKTGKFKRYLHSSTNENSLDSDYVRKILEDSTGQMWVGTDQGLSRFDPKTGVFSPLANQHEEISDANIVSLQEDKNGNLWIGTDGKGLFSLDKTRTQIDQYKQDPEDSTSISHNKIPVIHEDNDGTLWFGTNGGGLSKFDNKQQRFIQYRNHPERKNSLSSDSIESLFRDRSGVLWIGTSVRGLDMLHPYSFGSTLNRNYPTEDVPYTHSQTRAFLRDRNGDLWVGSVGDGIRKTTKEGKTIVYVNKPSSPSSLGNNDVFSFLEDRNGTVWIGTNDGLIHRYNRKQDNFTRYASQPTEFKSGHHGRVRSLIEDHAGILWVGVEGGGLHSFNKQTAEFKHFHFDRNNPSSISNDRVFKIVQDRAGTIWVATMGGGLNKFDSQSGKFRRFIHSADRNSINRDNVLSLHQDKKENVLWLGIDGGGIDRFDIKTETFKNFNMENGLANNKIYGILQEKKGQLWVSHNKGLSEFDPKSVTFSNYEEVDGLQSNEFNGGAYYESPEGKLYFGGINGYNAFYPSQIKDNLHAPPVVITDFQLYRKSIGIGEKHDDRIILKQAIYALEKLALSYKDYVLSFEFSSLDFVASERNQYAYKMEGLEEEWNYVGNEHFVTYTTLPPGEYVFRVKASNSHGVWNEEGTSIAITITPPFWKTWWFMISGILLFVTLIFSVPFVRVRSIRTRNQLLERQVDSRTIELKGKTDELESQKTKLEETLLELSGTKDALIEAAHQSGMADSATGVLHNVGNILNSVTTSAGVIQETLSNSVLSRFVKANGILRENIENIVEFLENDPKGKKLLDYYLALEDSFENENKSLRENSRRLSEKIGAIREAIAAQQRYAKRDGFGEVLALEDLIEDTMMMHADSIGRHDIEVRKNIADIPRVKVQKTKVVQILLNLYKNAKESLDEANPKNKLLTIDLDQDIDNAFIRVTDNGLGIEKEALKSIFAYGFTTKTDGHGFGLHSCANYMTEMGGTITAESEGSGKGASFTLKFPIKPSTEVDEVETETQPTETVSSAVNTTQTTNEIRESI